MSPRMKTLEAYCRNGSGSWSATLRGPPCPSNSAPASTKTGLTWAGTRWKEAGYVFTTGIRTPLDPRDLLRDYYAITKPKAKPGEPKPEPKFPAIRFHDLRHSAATLLLAQGVSARYITELLGHSQVSFTLQTYAHVLPEVQKAIATKMDEILAPIPAPGPVAATVATNGVQAPTKCL
jgi:integrase